MYRKVNVVFRFIFISFVMTLLAMFTLSAVEAESREIPNQLVVLYESEDHDFSKLDVDHEKVNAVENVSDYVDVVYLKNSKDAPEMIRAIENCPGVEAVDHEAIGEIENVPNDPGYSNQEAYLSQINFTGVKYGDRSVKVAVVDSGVDDHEDLGGRIERSGYNYIDGNKTTTDKQEHGTFVSGIIAAVSNNEKGITGVVGPSDIKIVPYVVVGSDGTGHVSELLSALTEIRNYRSDIKIINLSLGFYDYNKSLDILCQELANQGKIILAASGNDNYDYLAYPARYDSTISVGAVNRNLQRCTPTDWGFSEEKEEQGSNYGTNLDVVAPGDNVFSTARNNQYGSGSGTSFAAPFVSASCALALTRLDSIDLGAVRSAIIDSSRDLLPTGWDGETGYGLLQIDSFVNKLVPSSETISTAPSTVTIKGREKILSLKAGEQQKLTASPSGVSWTSTDSKVVTVDQDGNITAKGAGKATIIARYHGKSDSITVEVLPPKVTGIEINNSSLVSLAIGNHAQLSASLSPAGAVGTITWDSNNNQVATVSSSGYVTAVGSGSCNITASCEGYSVQIEVRVSEKQTTVIPTPQKPAPSPSPSTPIGPSVPSTPVTPPQDTPQKVAGIEISGEKSYELKPGGKVKLTAKLKPSGATGTINWTVSNSSVATVDKNGNVTAKGAGKCTITAECSGFKASVTINVVQETPEITGVKITGSKNVEVTLGAKTRLSAVLEPAGAKGTISWNSSNTGVATIDTSGNITTVGAGTTTITASCKNFKDTVTLTVRSASQQPQPTPTPTPQPEPTPVPSQSISIYRLYNAENNEHLYTSDQNEAQVLSQNGWKDEGIGWNSPNNGDPVYRLYSPVTNEHHYTKDANEVSVLSQQGWSIDNNGQPLFYSGGNRSIFRLYHEGTRRHHLTTDENEYNVLQSQGWNAEGIALYSIG